VSAGGVKLSAEWRAVLDTLDPGTFAARLAKGTSIAGERIGRQFQRNARSRIRGKAYGENSPVTVILKGSSTPLVDKGDLFQAVTFEVIDPYNVRLGVMRRAVGDQAINVALILHEGATIDTRKHPKVRAKVFAMLRDRMGAERLAALNPRSRASVRKAAAVLGLSQKRAMHARQGRGTAPGGTGSPIWIIPARPFIATPIQDPEFRKFIVVQYAQAVRAAIGGR
jgi:hypothetical protein